MKQYNKKNYNLETIVQFIAAICCSLIINLSILILPFIKLKSIDAVVKKWDVRCFSFMLRIIFVALLVFALFRLADHLLNRMPAGKSVSIQRPKQRSVFIHTFIITLLFWSICFMVFFPGAGMNDTINGFISPSICGNMQPFLYQLYLYTIFSLGQRLSGGIGTLSFALLTIIQMVFCSFCVAFSNEWLCAKGLLGKRTATVYCLYFALHPIIVDYSMTIVKDVPFSFSLLLIIPIIYDIVHGEMTPNRWVLFAFGILVFWFSRSNGEYVAAIVLIAILIRFKVYVKEILGILVAMLIIDGASTLVLASTNPTNVSMRESSGIMLNQISAVIAAEGNISEESIDTIDKILPYEQWGQKYKVSFVDTLKFAPDFDATYLEDHKVEFVKAWFSTALLNPTTFAKAYTLQTYGLWSIMPNSPVDYTQSFFTTIHNNVGDDSSWAAFCREHNCVNIRLLPNHMGSWLENHYVSSFKNCLKVQPGLYLITFIILFVLSLGKPSVSRNDMQGISFLFGIPLLIFLTQMVACPASFIFRYSFYLVLTMPLLTVLVIKVRVYPDKLKA